MKKSLVFLLALVLMINMTIFATEPIQTEEEMEIASFLNENEISMDLINRLKDLYDPEKNEGEVIIGNFNDKIIEIKNLADTYNFSKEQIEDYIEGIISTPNVIAGLPLQSEIYTTSVPSSSAADIAMENVPFDVMINGQEIIEEDEYPLLFYKGIVYLPTTCNMNSFVGLRVEFYPNYIRGDIKMGSIFVGLNSIETDEYTPYRKNSTETKGKIHEEAIVINESGPNILCDIHNTAREYPIVNCKNVLYIPLTYDIAAEKLDWKMSFSPEKGLIIETRSPNRPILDIPESSTVGFTGTIKAVVRWNYVFSENAYAGYPFSTFSTNEFKYKEVNGEEVRQKIRKANGEDAFKGGDYSFNRQTVTGTDVTKTEACIAVLEPEGILKMPAVKAHYINDVHTRTNVYLTIDVKNGILLKEEII